MGDKDCEHFETTILNQGLQLSEKEKESCRSLFVVLFKRLRGVFSLSFVVPLAAILQYR